MHLCCSWTSVVSLQQPEARSCICQVLKPRRQHLQSHVVQLDGQAVQLNSARSIRPAQCRLTQVNPSQVR